jgi:hypothetical protein
MKTFKVLQIKTEAAAHVVVRNAKGRKLFDLQVPGVSITVAVPSNTELKIKDRPNDK